MQLYLTHQRLLDRDPHQLGRQLLCQLYRQHVGPELPEIAIAPLGKPYFLDNSWHFSISHSKTHVFCVLADCPVGLDAEELSRRVNPLLAKKILSPRELQQYEDAPDKNRALLTFWVLKEAQGKLSGKGVALHPVHTNFMLTDSRVTEVDGCLVAICTQEEIPHAL